MQGFNGMGGGLSGQIEIDPSSQLRGLFQKSSRSMISIPRVMQELHDLKSREPLKKSPSKGA
jgi:hypothetical protein